MEGSCFQVKGGMFEQALSSFSAERYYVLSEIEQKARIFYSEENDKRIEEIPGQEDSLILTVLYSLWDITSHADAELIITKVENLLSYAKKENQLSANLFIVIDALVKSKGSVDKSTRKFIEKVLNRVHSLPEVSTVLIGVSDNTGSLPAMERCHEIVEAIHPGMEEYEKDIAFIVSRGQEMLGHDPTLEPDAKSGVHQVLFWIHESAQNDLLQKVRSTSEKSVHAPLKAKHLAMLFALTYVLPLVALFLLAGLMWYSQA